MAALLIHPFNKARNSTRFDTSCIASPLSGGQRLLWTRPVDQSKAHPWTVSALPVAPKPSGTFRPPRHATFSKPANRGSESPLADDTANPTPATAHGPLERTGSRWRWGFLGVRRTLLRIDFFLLRCLNHLNCRVTNLHIATHFVYMLRTFWPLIESFVDLNPFLWCKQSPDSVHRCSPPTNVNSMLDACSCQAHTVFNFRYLHPHLGLVNRAKDLSSFWIRNVLVCRIQNIKERTGRDAVLPTDVER